jgi:hypothetical protein
VTSCEFVLEKALNTRGNHLICYAARGVDRLLIDGYVGRVVGWVRHQTRVNI